MYLDIFSIDLDAIDSHKQENGGTIAFFCLLTCFSIGK